MEVIVRQECGTQCQSGVETMREFCFFLFAYTWLKFYKTAKQQCLHCRCKQSHCGASFDISRV